MLKFNYGIGSKMVLNDPKIEEKLTWIKNGGVSTMWLWGFFYGHYEDSLENMSEAKKILEQHGFEVGVCCLPVGHPGNSLDPTNPDLDLEIPKHWDYRIDSKGKPAYYCACINETMINDNKVAIEAFKSIGIKKFFMDDDLRMANWGKRTEGCFCDKCIAEFNAKYAVKNVTRAQLDDICDKDENDINLSSVEAEILELWQTYNCSKVTKLISETKTDGIQSGIMVMHDGDKRHGLDIEAIKLAVPNCMIRVGESHFCDDDFGPQSGKDSLVSSIKNHMMLIDDVNLAYSESTVFPANALSPENFITKIKLEIGCGLKNIFLMSGTWFLEKPYWDILAKNLDELNELSEK